VQQDHASQHNDAGCSRGEEWGSGMPRERQRRPGRERPGRGALRWLLRPDLGYNLMEAPSSVADY
jgi:hypothetical protein